MPREVCELALAHVNSDRVEAAYRRSDLFDKRRDLMAARAAYVTEAGNQTARRQRPQAGNASERTQRDDHATKPLDQIVLMPNGRFVPDRPCLDALA